MHVTISFPFVYFSTSIEIRDHVKPFRLGTSFRSIHDVKHFSFLFFLYLFLFGPDKHVISAKYLIICHLVRRHRLRKYNK